MRLTAKPVYFGTPLLIAVGTFVLLWMLVGGGSGNDGDNALVETNVNWSVFNSEGILLSAGSGHNATADNLSLNARNRLHDIVSVTFGDRFNNIGICSADQSGITTDGDTQSSACTLIASGDISGDNPRIAGSITTSDVAHPFVYVLQDTFTAGTGFTITELVLSKNAAADVAPSNTDIGAVEEVSITLANTDTLQITWTVTVN